MQRINFVAGLSRSHKIPKNYRYTTHRSSYHTSRVKDMGSTHFPTALHSNDNSLATCTYIQISFEKSPQNYHILSNLKFCEQIPIDYREKVRKLHQGMASAAHSGGGSKLFPMKLHDMLTMSEFKGLDSIISWLPNGRAFKVHDPKLFATEIMGEHFHQSKFKSFQRQLVRTQNQK